MIIKQSDNKNIITISKSDWEKIGKLKGWIKKSEDLSHEPQLYVEEIKNFDLKPFLKKINNLGFIKKIPIDTIEEYILKMEEVRNTIFAGHYKVSQQDLFLLNEKYELFFNEKQNRSEREYQEDLSKRSRELQHKNEIKQMEDYYNQKNY